MKVIIGLLMIPAGIGLGLYVGGYICFFGGIVTLIEQVALTVKTGSVAASAVAWAVVKIFGAGLAGWLSAIALILPGKCLIDAS